MPPLFSFLTLCLRSALEEFQGVRIEGKPLNLLFKLNPALHELLSGPRSALEEFRWVCIEGKSHSIYYSN
jgi:hypothetical protein